MNCYHFVMLSPHFLSENPFDYDEFYNYYLKIPYDQVTLNPNLVQNEGY